LNKNSRLKL